jgi:hypothetical protein
MVNPPRSTRARRSAAAALLAALAIPAAAYVPPASAVLKRVAQRRDDLGLAAMQVQGTLVLAGEAARRAQAGGLAAAGPELAVPATLLVKAPGRCRLELAPPGASAADRPSLSVRGSRASARRGLDSVPAAVALVEGVCTLLAERGGGDSERALAQALTARGVALGDVAFGRLGARVAYVLGARPQQTTVPQAWIDKQTFQPVRLVARFADAPRDVRLVDFGSPVGGDGFPRAVEVWNGKELEARFTAEKVTPNPRLPDSMF